MLRIITKDVERRDDAAKEKQCIKCKELLQKMLSEEIM